jgi:hypothetical protein
VRWRSPAHFFSGVQVTISIGGVYLSRTVGDLVIILEMRLGSEP